MKPILIAILSPWFLTESKSAVVVDPMIVFETGPYNGGLWPSDLSAPSTGGVPPQFADTINLTEPALVSSITFWGGYFEPVHGVLPVDAFSLRIFGTSGIVPDDAPFLNIPLSVIEREVFIPGTDFSIPIYQISADFTQTLLPSETLGVSIVNDLSGSPLIWHQGLSMDLAGDGFTRAADGDPWTMVLGELAIELRGNTVPEPSTTTLLGLVLMLLLGRRRMRTR